MITIKENDYVQDKTIREDVVQRICDTFLAGRTFLPFNDGQGVGTNATLYVSNRIGYPQFTHDDKYDKTAVRFNTEEMKTAFKLLIDKKYHMFKTIDRIQGIAFVCSKKPFLYGAEEVFVYDYFID